MLTLAACGSTGRQDSNSASSTPEGDTPTSTIPETPPVKQPEDTTPAEEQTPEGTDDGEKKVLNAEESVLTPEGKIDYHTLKPVLFEMPTYEYLRTGEVIGKCMSYGKQEVSK